MIQITPRYCNHDWKVTETSTNLDPPIVNKVCLKCKYEWNALDEYREEQERNKHMKKIDIMEDLRVKLLKVAYKCLDEVVLKELLDK